MRCSPRAARHARRQRLSPAECAAHDGRNRGGEPPAGGDPRRIHGENRVTKPIIDRLALIGVGLIGGSIARAAREYGAVRTIVATARSDGDAQARDRARHRRSGGRDQRRSRQGCRPRDRLHPGGRERAGDGGNRIVAQARRDRLRRGLGQGRGREGHCAVCSERRPSESRRIRSPAPKIPDPIPVFPSCSSIAGAS